MSTTGVSFKIGTDNTEAKQAIKEFRDEFKALRNELKTAVTDIKIKVSADGADIFNEIKSELKEFRKLFSKEKVSISVTADMSDVTSELKQINQHIQQTNRQLDSIGNHATNAGNVAASGLSPLATSIKQVIAGYATLATAQLFIGVTDEAKKLEGQLKLVTKSEQELIIVRQMLLDQSNKTGTQMSSSVELYTKMYNATRNLNGASNALLVRVTDITNKFVAIGGSSGESANAALVQFAQAMASGVLRGEELNSVMEQAPGLSKGLADGLGVSIGQLRAMAADGKLTTDVVINALLKMGKTADEQFLKMPRQAAQSTTAIKNDFKSMVAELDKEWGFSKSFIESLEWLRSHLPQIKQLILDVVDAAKIAGAALLVAFGAPALIQAIGLLRVLIAALRLQLFALSVQAGATGGWVALIAALRGTQAATLSLKSAFGVFAAAMVGWEIGSYLRNEFEIVEIAGNKLGQWLAKFVVQWQNSWREIQFFIKNFSLKPRSVEEEEKYQLEKARMLTEGQNSYNAVNEDLPTRREEAAAAEAAKKNQADKKTDIDNDKVSNKPVKPEIDKLQERIILIKAAIAKEEEYTSKKRANISELGQLEMQVLKNKLKTVQTDAKEQGKIQNEILEKDLANQQELADFDKQRANEAKKNASELTQAKYEYEKKIIDQQIKDNEQLYKDQQINFVAYTDTKSDLNQKLYNLETSYLSQLAAKSDQHERSLIAYKLKNVNIEAAARQNALLQEHNEYMKDLEKRKQAILDIIDDNNIDINADDLEKSLWQVTKTFKKTKEQIDELKKALGEKIAVDFTLPNGVVVKLSHDLINDLQKQVDQQEIEIKTKIALDSQQKQIQKNVDKILSDKSYRDKYADIQANMNPMQRPSLEEKKRLDTLETIPKLKAELQDLYNLQKQMQNEKFNIDALEEINKKIQDLNINIKELEASAPTFWQEFRTNIIETSITAAESGLADYFLDIMEGTKTANQALKDLARTFISSIVQMAAQALAKLAIFAALNAMTGGAASAGTGFAGVAAKTLGFVQHTGGIAGSTGNSRNIDPAVYNHAPRYHVGGIAGFKPNEVPAILEKGEEVLTRNDPRHIANGGKNSSPNVVTKVIVAFTEEQVAENMASSAGERVQLNTIQRNIGTIKQMLADD